MDNYKSFVERLPNKEPEQTATHPNQKVVQFDDNGFLI